MDPRPPRQRAIPRAYLLTFRTYGSWLPGDPRGSIERTLNAYGAPRIAPSGRLEGHAAALMKAPSLVLDQAQREIVELAITGVCTHRGWSLLAVNARSNHVHVVVTAASDPAPIVVAFKAWATRRLRESGTIEREQPVWAEGCSERFLWSDDEVEGARVYVVEFQDAPL